MTIQPIDCFSSFYLPSIFMEKKRNKIKICLCQSEGRPRVLLAPAPFLPTFSRRLIIFLDRSLSDTIETNVEPHPAFFFE